MVPGKEFKAVLIVRLYFPCFKMEIYIRRNVNSDTYIVTMHVTAIIFFELGAKILIARHFIIIFLFKKNVLDCNSFKYK